MCRWSVCCGENATLGKLAVSPVLADDDAASCAWAWAEWPDKTPTWRIECVYVPAGAEDWPERVARAE